ncbi:MAG: YvcK family protein, partial [Acidaminococcaceae bacterium]
MSWIKWLCPGLNLKRWLLLFAIGVIFAATGTALVFNYQFIGFIEELLFKLMYMATGEYYHAISVAGGISVLVIGMFIMFYATRKLIHSVMESVLPDNNTSLMERIFTQRKLTKGPAITVVGGGTGLSVLLRGMKYITNNCTAVVTVADDGGSSGRLRQELGILPPGDLRNCLVALADTEPLMEKVMQYRFKGETPLAGHNLGNLFIAAMAAVEGSMEAGLIATSEILKVRGNVLPSTLEDIQLTAEMADGTGINWPSPILEHRTPEAARF